MLHATISKLLMSPCWVQLSRKLAQPPLTRPQPETSATTSGLCREAADSSSASGAEAAEAIGDVPPDRRAGDP